MPEQYMQTPGSRFDEASQRWVWEYEGEDMPLELGATVRFKVREVLFQQPDATAAGKDGALSACNLCGCTLILTMHRPAYGTSQRSTCGCCASAAAAGLYVTGDSVRSC